MKQQQHGRVRPSESRERFKREIQQQRGKQAKRDEHGRFQPKR